MNWFSNNRNIVIKLIITIMGVFIILFGITIFNKYLLVQLPSRLRLLLTMILPWSLISVPAIQMRINNEKISDYWATTENITQQIIIGIILAFILSAFLTIIPILLGFKEIVGNTLYYYPWQFVYNFIYMIFSVALVEEFIFRGYIFKNLLYIKNSRWFAIVVSSILFGFFHVFNGDFIQIFMTTMIGLLLCIFREKIKNCTIFSLVIVHGLYGGMINLWYTLL